MAKPKFATKADAGRGFDLQLVDDTGNKIDWFITVVGADSAVYRDKINEIQRRQIEALTAGRRVIDSPEQRATDALELLAACTISWKGADALEAFSPGAALRLYDEYRSISEQVDRAISNRANFLRSAATA